jgi:Uncharacterized flavoproteins
MNQVVYVSRGGNTKKIADTIAKAINASASSVEQIQLLSDIDILFVGVSLYAGDIDKKMRNFLVNLKSTQVKKVVVFGTSAVGKSGMDIVKTILEPNGISVLAEEFYCKGSFLLANRGKPNAEDLEEAAVFAQKVVSKN